MVKGRLEFRLQAVGRKKLLVSRLKAELRTV
jgi:hypothetical protein